MQLSISTPFGLLILQVPFSAVKPKLDSYVFFKVTENTDGVMVESETAEARSECTRRYLKKDDYKRFSSLCFSEEIVDLKEGDQHLMRYRPIADLLLSSSVKLIWNAFIYLHQNILPPIVHISQKEWLYNY